MPASGLLILIGLAVCGLYFPFRPKTAAADEAKPEPPSPRRDIRAEKQAEKPATDFEDRTVWDPRVQFDRVPGRPKQSQPDLSRGIREAKKKRRRIRLEDQVEPASRRTLSTRQLTIRLILAGCLAYLMLPKTCSSGNWLREDRWRGNAYPDRYNLAWSISLGEFDSPAECRVAAFSALRSAHQMRCQYCPDHSEEARCVDCQTDPLEVGDWECGKNCELEESGLYLCED
jgi:hypothetical protein